MKKKTKACNYIYLFRLCFLTFSILQSKTNVSPSYRVTRGRSAEMRKESRGKEKIH